MLFFFQPSLSHFYLELVVLQSTKIAKFLGDHPSMLYAGSNVNLTITTDSLNMVVMETGEVSRILFKKYPSLKVLSWISTHRE